MKKIEIFLNGEKRIVPSVWAVIDLIDQLDLKDEQVAVEVNQEIISRSFWGKQQLVSGDRIEIVHFVGGGAC